MKIAMASTISRPANQSVTIFDSGTLAAPRRCRKQPPGGEAGEAAGQAAEHRPSRHQQQPGDGDPAVAEAAASAPAGRR